MLLHEFDPAADAVLNPQMCVDPIPYFPPVTVACFSHRLFEQALGYPYREGITWTTNAPYRETADKVARRKEQGAICVEMECAGMQALCQFRGTEFFQYFYAGDNLDHSSWQPRSLGNNMMDEKSKILLLAFELGVRILSEDSNKCQKGVDKLSAPFLPLQVYRYKIIYPAIVNEATVNSSMPGFKSAASSEPSGREDSLRSAEGVSSRSSLRRSNFQKALMAYAAQNR